MAVAYKGGKCQQCGYDRCLNALDFHHRDPAQKDFAISQYGHSRSWERVRKELDKCVIVCANCHREIHAGMQLPQETVVEKRVNSGNP
jgi:predicted HNH restriction endonuclease